MLLKTRIIETKSKKTNRYIMAINVLIYPKSYFLFTFFALGKAATILKIFIHCPTCIFLSILFKPFYIYLE